jgi:NADPH:quinone reductase-like Zn-dependent oxidoreductase
MAGEIVAVGGDVKGWKKGDRVCANFATDHIYGDTNPAIQRTALGGPTHGVLTEYRTFPAHVRTLRSEVEAANISRSVACLNPKLSFL